MTKPKYLTTTEDSVQVTIEMITEKISNIDTFIKNENN